MFSPRRAECRDLYAFCLKNSFESVREEARPSRERANPPKHFVCPTFPFSTGSVLCQVHRQVKRGENQGRHLSQNGGFIPAAEHTLTQSGAQSVFPSLSQPCSHVWKTLTWLWKSPCFPSSDSIRWIKLLCDSFTGCFLSLCVCVEGVEWGV